eukprot:2099788-Rhodomonas_salina.2
MASGSRFRPFCTLLSASRRSSCLTRMDRITCTRSQTHHVSRWASSTPSCRARRRRGRSCPSDSARKTALLRAPAAPNRCQRPQKHVSARNTPVCACSLFVLYAQTAGAHRTTSSTQQNPKGQPVAKEKKKEEEKEEGTGGGKGREPNPPV